jgi:hypothetical protein
LERESKEKLSRENERLIKEIVEMNMRQEKERLKQESDLTCMYFIFKLFFLESSLIDPVLGGNLN